MRNIWDTVGRFFGGSHNDKCQELLVTLVKIGTDCAAHLRKSGGKDLPGIIEFEHRADRIVDDIHELLDDSFIMRFDIADMMRLADEIDDVIDGMRKVATHMDIYKGPLATLRPEALELMDQVESMLTTLQRLIAMMGGRRLSLPEVRKVVNELDDSEAAADKVLAGAERKLVEEFSPKAANRLDFIALDKLYQLLEETTDSAKHCGKLILSLARKEA